MKKGSLYLVPTPLGSFDTNSRVLPQYNIEQVHKLQIFIVEQVRTARRFLSSIKHPIAIDDMVFLELNKHTAESDVFSYLDRAKEGEDIGLLSEAGTPCVADPGSRIVNMAHESGIEVIPLVGPNSIILALMASGFNGQNFTFHGYLPVDKGGLIKSIKEIENNVYKKNQTQIFIETPFRNSNIFKTITSVCSRSTKLCVATDLTLPTENIQTKTISRWGKKVPEFHKKPTVFLLYK